MTTRSPPFMADSWAQMPTMVQLALVAASGFWRWRFRGGALAAAHTAFWGSIIDWLAAEQADARAASPADGALREGFRAGRIKGVDAGSGIAKIGSRSPAAPARCSTSCRCRSPSSGRSARSAS